MSSRNDLNYTALQLRVAAVEAAYSRLVRQRDELVATLADVAQINDIAIEEKFGSHSFAGMAIRKARAALAKIKANA